MSALRRACGALGQYLDARTLPEANVASLHSIARSEDGETLVVMVELADGRTAVLSICEGEPIGLYVQ